MKTGDYSNVDAGDLLELYINSTELGDTYDEMGWLGDYFMWRQKFTADVLQNTAEFGMDVYDAGVSFGEGVQNITKDLANPFKAQSWKNIGPYWKRKFGFEEGGLVTRSYQDEVPL